MWWDLQWSADVRLMFQQGLTKQLVPIWAPDHFVFDFFVLISCWGLSTFAQLSYKLGTCESDMLVHDEWSETHGIIS